MMEEAPVVNPERLKVPDADLNALSHCLTEQGKCRSSLSSV